MAQYWQCNQVRKHTLLQNWNRLTIELRQAQELGLHLESKIVQGPGDSVEDTLVRLWDDELLRAKASLIPP
jgi:hypothetical protein